MMMRSLFAERMWGVCLDIWTSSIHLLFPAACEVCGDGLACGEKHICTACLTDFPFVYPGNGLITGKVLKKIDPELDIRQLYALFYYNKHSDYKNLLYSIKYQGRAKLAVYLGKMLGEQIAKNCQADVIIPIPLHKQRERRRGFNQAYEIAKGVSLVTGIPVLKEVVVRVKNNVSQTGKTSAQRLMNVENIFELRQPIKISNQHVLLLDDVITTGATIESCMRMLAGANGVTFSLACLALTD